MVIPGTARLIYDYSKSFLLNSFFTIYVTNFTSFDKTLVMNMTKLGLSRFSHVHMYSG